MKGAIGGAANEAYGIYVAGGIVAGTSYGLDSINNKNPSVGKALTEGITTMVGGKLADSAAGISGRLPNPGTANYYLGQHAQQLGLAELAQNAFSSVVSLFTPSNSKK